MSQWGQGQPGFQYPMQTGFPAGNPQFQQNPQFQPQNPQFQQPNPQFQQQGGMGMSPGGGLMPQQTGFPGQRMGGMMQPQQTGYPGQLQPQATGFPGGGFQQQRPVPPPVPPVPTMPSQFQQNRPSFLNAPPPQQPNRLMSASPGFGGGGLVPQATGFPGASGGLVPQMTGFVDPRLTMMSQSFMPVNTSAPFNAQGMPMLQPQTQNLVQSFQQHNQAQRGSATQQLSWALTKGEKKNYDNIFRQWVQGQKYMDGKTAIEVFGASGLQKDDLARVWFLADVEDRGKLDLAEFHVAMGLIYRRLNGMPLPDTLPQELIPPSRRDLDDSVDRVKDLLSRENRANTPNTDSPVSYLKNRSFNGASPSFDSNRDATIYKHSDTESSSVYKPRSRHVDRDAIRSRQDEESPSADIQDMKRALANTSYMLDKAHESDQRKSREDEELDREMDDLKYRVKRVQEDLDYHARRPKTASGEEERRRLEREMLQLMHERIPEVERRIKLREERKDREKREWARERDRANDRFGRYDRGRDDYDRDRPYSRGAYDDRDRDRDYRPASRGDYRDRERYDDRERPYSRGSYDDRDRDRERERDRRDYDRPRSPPTSRSAPPPPAEAPAKTARDSPAPPPPKAAPSPSLSSMSPEERKAYMREQARARVQARMEILNPTPQSSTPSIDTTVQERLDQERKENEEKVKAAEKQAEERERVRRERLDNEKALKEGRTTPAAPTPASPVPAAVTPKAAPLPTPKAAPPPPKPRAPAPPPPKPRAGAGAPPATVPVPAPPPPAAPAPARVPEVDPEEEAFRAREAALQKAREERENARLDRERKLRELEEAEAQAAREEEERYQQRLQSLKAKPAKSPSPPPAPSPPVQSRAQAIPPPPLAPPPPPAPGPASAPAEKSTNPFSKLLKEGGGAAATASTPSGTSSANPWAKPQTTPLVTPPRPSKSPAPPSSISAKSSYQTAPSSSIDDDWDDIKENDGSDESSDDEIAVSRSARANIAQALFGGMVPRPSSASAPSTPAPGATSSVPPPPAPGPPPPPPAPSAPPAPVPPPPPAFAAPAPVSAGSDGRGALFAAIQGGKALKPTKTVDKSGPQLSGKVVGDTAPPAHISAVARPPSPPRAPSPPPAPQPALSIEAPSMDNGVSKSDNRQSVGWFADRAADLGESPVLVERLPSTLEDDEEEGLVKSIPDILVDEHVEQPTDLMADIDKSVEHRVRSLYAFEGDGPDDLSFAENLMIIANPSKSGGDWWFGKLVGSGKSGLFPQTYVQVVNSKKAKALYTYTGENPDELSFTEGDTLDIVDTAEEEWWKAEQGGAVYIVPAAYLEPAEG